MFTLGVWWWTSMPPQGADSAVVGAPTTDSSLGTILGGPGGTTLLLVHVAGEVRAPGVVQLEEGARVVDAIEAAGGATSGAVLSSVNLAAEVRDGSQIVVPSRDAPRAPGTAGDGLVAINTATSSELEALPGVGPVLAGRILDHRDEFGAFDTVEDLLDVSGIGESILARLRPFIRLP